MPHQKSKEGWLSVTEVLTLSIPKPFLNYWYGSLGTQKCEQIKKESQKIGIMVHELIEKYLKGESVGEELNIHRMVNNFIYHFAAPYEIKALKLEQTYEDPRLKLQGTVDGEIDTNKWKDVTADWKTSNSLDKIGVPLQLSMYDYLRKGSGKGVAVRIDKEKDKIEIKWYDNLKEYELIWKACIIVARYQKFGIKDKESE